MTALPLFQYPLTIAMLDDDPLMLKAVSYLFREKYFQKTFLDTKQALHFFEEYKPLLPSLHFLRACIEHDHYETLNSLPVDINSKMLIDLQKNTEKHAEIAVLIVDYNMPNMTGIEFCRAIQSLPMKKILLTGEVDHSLAITAFNDGLIDRFIRKDSATLTEELMLYVETLTNQYLCDTTKKLVSHLEVAQSLPFSDKHFASFFANWRSDNNIREHYLLDKTGNFTVVNETGKLSHFIIHTEKTLNEFVSLYDDNEKLIPFIEAVSRREKIPFFGIGKEAWEFIPEEWGNHFYSPEIFDGRERYYFVCVH